MTTAIWNHDLTSDRTVITSGGNVTVIGPGAMQEFEGKLGEEVLAEARRSGVPFSTEAAQAVVVGSVVFEKRKDSFGNIRHCVVNSPTLMVPVGIFDKANLMRLDRDLLLRMAACLGAVLEEEATKKACVEIILDRQGVAVENRSHKTGDDISGSANVPPTVTGETNPAPTEKQEKQ